MDDTSAKENPAPDFNKIDLTQLQGFSFGTQWTQDKSDPTGRARERREHPREGGGEPRRDRRTFRKPAVTVAPGEAPAESEAPAPADRAFADHPRRERNFRGGPRRDSREGHGGERPAYEPRSHARRGGPDQPRPPYESPFFNIAFYPEDVSFSALAKTIRASCRTLELFEIARTILAKNERFVAVVQRKPTPSPAAPESGVSAAPAPAVPASRPAPLFLSVPDGVPFETEEAAIAHVISRHLDKFFDLGEVEVEPPKGNFQVINRCTLTGELLGPPNYHRYNQILQQHHAATANRMPFEKFRERIESVRDPELINQWLEKMKKATRYTWKAARPPESVALAAESLAAAPAAETPPAENSPAVEPAAPAAPPPPTFDTLEEARAYLLSHAREKVLRPVEHARFHGKSFDLIPPGEIRRATEGQLERQRRFPLDTANGLRGRLRREGFTIFKKGSKGISYVCAVKRKFRVPGQTFAESIGALIAFIEGRPMIRASELPEKFLGFDPPAPKPAETAPASSAPESPGAETPTSVPPPELMPEQREKLARLQGDLRWLVTEGYVTEFIDGRLFAPPPMAEARKKEAEAAEIDPENFPEAPESETAVAEPPPAADAASPAQTDPASENGAEPAPAPADESVAPTEPAATEPPAHGETSST